MTNRPPSALAFKPLYTSFTLFVLLLPFLNNHSHDEPSGYTIEPYTTANFPVKMAFAPDGRLFFTEKFTGNLRVISADGELQREPVLQLNVSGGGEQGMLGIALDPAYQQNGLIWLVYTSKDAPVSNNLIRFREDDGTGYDPEVMFVSPVTPGILIHNGGNVLFDTDGLLYISFGDSDNPANSQDLDAIQGKIHRFMVTDDGLVPAPDNPFPDSSVYAYGFRNPFDFAIDPISGAVFTTENGPLCDDELNRVLPSMNYGWTPDYICVGTAPLDLPDYVPPMLSYDHSEAPTGIIIYDHPAVPEWQGNLFFCTWNSGIMSRVVLNEDRTEIDSIFEVDLQGRKCQIDMAVGPEGAIYFSTPNDIFRLMPLGIIEQLH